MPAVLGELPSRRAVHTVSWLRRRDPGLAVLRRAARVTVAACVGFYLCRYLLGDPTTATCAIFSTIALGALSQVSGRPAQRARTYLGAFAAGVVLVSLGTAAAVNTLTAVAGMLLIGFAVAYSGIGGPRLAEVANGLQLFYVLPCFPPYALDSLPQRLVGLAVGVLLLALADRLLWPAPSPPEFCGRVADTAAKVARYASAVRDALQAGAAEEALTGPGLVTLRDDAADAAETLQLGELPVAERPTGPGRRDRSLIYIAAAVRNVSGRLGALTDLLDRQQVAPASPATAKMVGTVSDTLESVCLALRGAGPPPSTEPLDAAVAEYTRLRASRLASEDGPPPQALRAGVTTLAIAEAARTAALASHGVQGATAASVAGPTRPDLPPALWFLHASPARLWWQRLQVHLTPRSVYLQNAVRLALGLAAARAVAGVFDLSHGFWVLLATLSLMRTSAIAIRATLVPALTGTLVGAVVAAALLTAIGQHTAIYAWALPAVMLASLAIGPLLGAAATQGSFTVLVSMLFAQVAPATYQLAAVRVLDVLIGGVVGALIGAAVWPRGGGAVLRQAAAGGLRAGAAQIIDTTRALTGAGPADEDPSGDPTAELARMAGLFDQAYAQYRTEPTHRGRPNDWLVVLAVLHRMESYGRALRVRHPGCAPLPWPDLAERLTTEASDVSLWYRMLAAEIERGEPAKVPAWAEQHQRIAESRPEAAFGTAPEAALRVFDTWGWLHDLVDDVARIERALP